MRAASRWAKAGMAFSPGAGARGGGELAAEVAGAGVAVAAARGSRGAVAALVHPSVIETITESHRPSAMRAA